MNKHFLGDVIKSKKGFYKCARVTGGNAFFNGCKRNGTEVDYSDEIELPEHYTLDNRGLFFAKGYNWEIWTINKLSRK